MHWPIPFRKFLPGRAPGHAAGEVFTRWAAAGRDEGMQHHHTPAVEEMLTAAFAALGGPSAFTAIDAGCGNGWTVRRLRAALGCRAVTGVDVSAGMIKKAQTLDPAGHYVLADLATWQPAERADLVVSMEVLYYLDDPAAFLRRVAAAWLKPGGVAVFGIDHYKENTPSLAWPAAVGVHMTTWPEARWIATLAEAGFTILRSWRAAARAGEAGTLVMLARTPAATAPQ